MKARLFAFELGRQQRGFHRGGRLFVPPAQVFLGGNTVAGAQDPQTRSLTPNPVFGLSKSASLSNVHFSDAEVGLGICK